VAAILWKTTRLLGEVIANDPQQRGIAAVSTPLSLDVRIILGPALLLIMVWLLFK
jgi:hypothetical protein